jgi:hypothetical protein
MEEICVSIIEERFPYETQVISINKTFTAFTLPENTYFVIVSLPKIIKENKVILKSVPIIFVKT